MRRALRIVVPAAVVVAVFSVLRVTRASDAVRVAGDSYGPPPAAGSYRDGEVIVQFRETTEEWAEERAMREVRPRRVRAGARAGRYLVQLGPDTSVAAALYRLGRLAEVDYVERNAIVRKSGTPQ